MQSQTKICFRSSLIVKNHSIFRCDTRLWLRANAVYSFHPWIFLLVYRNHELTATVVLVDILFFIHQLYICNLLCCHLHIIDVSTVFVVLCAMFLGIFVILCLSYRSVNMNVRSSHGRLSHPKCVPQINLYHSQYILYCRTQQLYRSQVTLQNVFQTSIQSGKPDSKIQFVA